MSATDATGPSSSTCALVEDSGIIRPIPTKRMLPSLPWSGGGSSRSSARASSPRAEAQPSKKVGHPRTDPQPTPHRPHRQMEMPARP